MAASFLKGGRQLALRRLAMTRLGRVVATGLVQKGRPLRRLALERGMEELLNEVPLVQF